MLRDLGETTVVLSRGYGGRLHGPVMVDPAKHLAGDVGDEPLMLSQTVPVTVARDRVGGVALARSQGASVIVMDDGFQNPAIAKDASLIVIDGERGLGNGKVFPAGPLRASLSPQLDRTDALIVIGDGSAADKPPPRSSRAATGAAVPSQAGSGRGSAACRQARAGVCRDRRSHAVFQDAARKRDRGDRGSAASTTIMRFRKARSRHWSQRQSAMR